MNAGRYTYICMYSLTVYLGTVYIYIYMHVYIHSVCLSSFDSLTVYVGTVYVCIYVCIFFSLSNIL